MGGGGGGGGELIQTHNNCNVKCIVAIVLNFAISDVYEYFFMYASHYIVSLYEEQLSFHCIKWVTATPSPTPYCEYVPAITCFTSVPVLPAYMVISSIVCQVFWRLMSVLLRLSTTLVLPPKFLAQCLC